MDNKQLKWLQAKRQLLEENINKLQFEVSKKAELMNGPALELNETLNNNQTAFEKRKDLYESLKLKNNKSKIEQEQYLFLKKLKNLCEKLDKSCEKFAQLQHRRTVCVLC